MREKAAKEKQEPTNDNSYKQALSVHEKRIQDMTNVVLSTLNDYAENKWYEKRSNTITKTATATKSVPFVTPKETKHATSLFRPTERKPLIHYTSGYPSFKYFEFIGKTVAFLQEECPSYLDLLKQMILNNSGVCVFVDLDHIEDDYGNVRKQFHEAVRCFLHFKCGNVYMISSKNRMMGSGMARLPVYKCSTVESKASFVLDEMESNENSKFIICGHGEYLEKIASKLHQSDIMVDIGDEESFEMLDHNDIEDYSLVEYILFYLAMKRV